MRLFFCGSLSDLLVLDCVSRKHNLSNNEKGVTVEKMLAVRDFGLLRAAVLSGYE